VVVLRYKWMSLECDGLGVESFTYVAVSVLEGLRGREAIVVSSGTVVKLNFICLHNLILKLMSSMCVICVNRMCCFIRSSTARFKNSEGLTTRITSTWARLYMTNLTHAINMKVIFITS
jgi:hypothetical protein